MEKSLRDCVEEAVGRPEVAAAVDGIYAELAAEIGKRQPICVISGKCCRFEEYGHRLYVTTMELAAFVRGLRQARPAEEVSRVMEEWDGTGCPFQVAKICGVHGIRPFGCRVFFCDATATQWQHDQYERFHGRLREMHETLGVGYWYVEWRAGLREVLTAGD